MNVNKKGSVKACHKLARKKTNASKTPIRRKIKINTLYRAVKAYEKFPRVVEIDKKAILYQTKKGKLYAVVSKQEHIDRYIETGKWLSKMSFRWDLFKLDLEVSLNLLAKCIRTFGRDRGPYVHRDLIATALKWKY